MIDKSERFTQLVRVGYFSRAILYGVMGYIALTSAARIAEGTSSVMEEVGDIPAGEVLLWVLVVGLAAYALFRFSSTVFDIENRGSDGKGWATRIGHAASGIGHLLLAWSAFQFATSGGGGSGDEGMQEAAAGVLSVTLGPVLLGIVGLGFFGGAVMQAKKAYSAEFMERISKDAPQATRWLGGAGFVSRAVVYAIIAWSLVQAAWLDSASEIETLGGAIASLAETGVWFTLLAIGLIAFGLFSLILARYRIIPDLDQEKLTPAFRD